MCNNLYLNFFTPIIIGIISSVIGGLVVYRYVMFRENKKDCQEKKEKCTKSLLSTQMAIILQMNASRGLRAFVDEILEFNFDGKTLKERFKNTNSQTEIAIALRAIVAKSPDLFNSLKQLANYLIVDPIANNIIILPYEIFGMLNIPLKKKNNEAELAQYFQELLALCNQKYATLIAQIMRTNKISDLVINSSILNESTKIDAIIEDKDRDQYLMAVAGIFTSARSLEQPINQHLDKADKALLKTAEYIEFLGISKPIPIIRGEGSLNCVRPIKARFSIFLQSKYQAEKSQVPSYASVGSISF